MVRMRRLIFNAATFVPGVAAIPAVRRRIVNRAIGTGGTISGRYCYSVWLRHLLWAANSGLQTSPHVVAELGPGDSLGTGIAALLSGAEQYFALDVVAHANADRNLEILDELVALFSAQADIPGDREFPGMYPKLGDYRFPSAILGRERIAAALQSDRITRIRHSLTDTAAPGSMVQYRAPWLDGSVIQPGAIDMIFSQAALEHIDELEQAYRGMRVWLGPDGFLSHQIDFSSHGWADQWDGHWAHSDLKWKLIRGRDAWSINREPESTHLRILEREEFRIVCHERARAESSITRARLAARFLGATAEDLTTSSTFLQAVKRSP
jgi:hypothetical protein